MQRLVWDVERSEPQPLEVKLSNKNSGYFRIGESIVFQLRDWKLMELGKLSSSGIKHSMKLFQLN